MGLDSIGAVEVTNTLATRFGVHLESVLVYECPTVPELADAVAAAVRHRQQVTEAALAPAPEAAQPAQPGPPSPDPTTTPTPPPTPPLAPPPAVSPPPAGSPTPSVTAAAAAPVPAPEPSPSSAERYDEHAVAVIGMAGRFPDTPTLDGFWADLAAGRQRTGEVPP